MTSRLGTSARLRGAGPIGPGANDDEGLNMTVALVSGGNRGLGLATAKQLAANGVRVVVGARSEADGQAAAAEVGHGATWVRLDVTDRESVGAAAALVDQRMGGLDILVDNAGVLPEATNASPTEVVDVRMFRETVETNVFGAVTRLEAFLPLLRQSESGRIVNVSTTMGSLQDQADPSSPYYAMAVPAHQSSKAALNSVTIALGKALAGSSIKVTSVCPDFVQTDLTPINRNQAPLTPEQAAGTVVAAAMLGADEPSGTFRDAHGPVPW